MASKSLADISLRLAKAAIKAGLREICFTDHLDYEPGAQHQTMVFDFAAYAQEYDALEIPGLKIRRGMEFGMLPDNAPQFALDVKKRDFDFVLGSVHFAEGKDVYFEDYWRGKTVFEAERRYLEQTLSCVQIHDQFDVLAHLNFVSKASAHPTNTNLRYEDHREVIDAILEELVKKDKGLELNTSGVDRCGGFLPELAVVERFRQLGGKVVTVGSDAHTQDRVGQYTRRACDALKDIFGYVCTFVKREPVFHKL